MKAKKLLVAALIAFDAPKKVTFGRTKDIESLKKDFYLNRDIKYLNKR